MAFLARFVLTITILAATTFVHAKTFDLNLYLFKPESNLAIRNNFFLDYYHYARCDVEIDDTNIAAVVNTSYPFINVRSSGFKRFNCEIKGKDRTYSFEFGSDVAMPDFWDESGFPQQNYGLLFGTDGKPILFDSPEVKFGGTWWFDSPWEENFYSKYHSWWGPIVDDTYQTPLAVFLEPFIIGGIEYPRGTFFRGPNFPEGLKFARIGGQFSFEEQAVSDDGKTIQSPLKATGYYTFDEKLSVPKVRITQAVFEDVPVQTLVHERTTAIIIDKGEFSGDRELEIKITRKSYGAVVFTASTQTHADQFEAGEEPNQVIFYCNQSNAYCSLDLAESGIDEKQNSQVYEVSVGYGTGYSRIVKNVEIIKTEMLELFFIAIVPPGCNLPSSCGLSVAQMNNAAAIDNIFVQSLFPLRDEGLSFAPDIKNNPEGNSVKPDFIRATAIGLKFSPGYSFPGFEYTSPSDAFMQDMSKLDNLRFKYFTGAVYSRPFGYVYPEYFRDRGFEEGAVGGRPKSFKVGISAFPTIFGVTAHELGHTFGLPGTVNNVGKNEEYDIVDGVVKSKRDANGFDIYEAFPLSSRFRLNKYNFMASASGLYSDYWINSRSWNILVNELSKAKDDPPVILVNFVIGTSGQVAPLRWMTFNSVAPEPGVGDGKVELISYDDEIIGTYNFDPIFSIPQEIGPDLQVHNSTVKVVIPYEENLKKIVIRNASGDIGYEVNVDSKLTEDAITEGVEKCFIASSIDDGFRYSFIRLSQEIANNAVSRSSLDLFSDAASVFQSKDTEADCEFETSAYSSTSDLIVRLDKLKSRIIKNYKLIEDVVPGDIDHDGDVDQNDLNIITAARNKPADGANDPRDLDADGKITALDARKLTQLCTRPRCATN